MSTTTTQDLEKWMRRIAALLAKADDRATGPDEAASFREKAEALMVRYRIEESMLAAAAPAGTGLAPVWQTWHVCQYRETDGRTTKEFAQEYKTIVSGVVKHVGGRCVFTATQVTDEETGLTELWWVAEVVGYESDLRYGQLLWSMAKSAFGDRLEPRVDPELSDQVNAYRLRKAGVEGRRIAMALWNNDAKHLRPKARKLYEAEALARGENPKELMGQGNSVKVYRKSYAEGFAVELWWRLERSKVEAPSDGALVLASRATGVEEAFYERYPQYRPTESAGALGDPREDCDRCKKAQSGYCNRHRYLKPKAGKDRAFNYGAFSQGKAAASTVDLGTHRTLK